MFFLLLSCTTGIIAGYLTSVSPWAYFIAACLTAPILLYLFKPDNAIFFSCLLGFGLTVFRMAGVCTPYYLDHHVVRFCNGNPHRISGRINSLPKKYQNKTRYTLNCNNIDAEPVAGQLILTVYHDHSKNLCGHYYMANTLSLHQNQGHTQFF